MLLEAEGITIFLCASALILTDNMQRSTSFTCVVSFLFAHKRQIIAHILGLHYELRCPLFRAFGHSASHFWNPNIRKWIHLHFKYHLIRQADAWLPLLLLVDCVSFVLFSYIMWLFSYFFLTALRFAKICLTNWPYDSDSGYYYMDIYDEMCCT